MGVGGFQELSLMVGEAPVTGRLRVGTALGCYGCRESGAGAWWGPVSRWGPELSEGQAGEAGEGVGAQGS